MLANIFLAILLALMILRDGTLAIRHHRPFRIAILMFWTLLLVAHYSGRSSLYPAIALLLFTALILKKQELPRLAKLLEEARDRKRSWPISDLWDLEIDGRSHKQPPRAPAIRVQPSLPFRSHLP